MLQHRLDSQAAELDHLVFTCSEGPCMEKHGCLYYDGVHVVLPSQARVDDEPGQFSCVDLGDFVIAEMDTWE